MKQVSEHESPKSDSGHQGPSARWRLAEQPTAVQDSTLRTSNSTLRSSSSASSLAFVAAACSAARDAACTAAGGNGAPGSPVDSDSTYSNQTRIIKT